MPKARTPTGPRFWPMVDKSGPLILDTPCWMWTGAAIRTGYGRVFHNGRVVYTHRVVLVLTGRLSELPPSTSLVCHRCDNPPCVNPDHLYIGTSKQNTRDCIKKNRFRPSGAPLNISQERARQILEEYDSVAGDVFKIALARKYGVSRRMVAQIIKDRGWRHEDDTPDQTS